MQASDELLKKLRQFEGCKLTAYKDAKGIPTIGVGHTRGVAMGQHISQEQADIYLREDVAGTERYLNKLPVTLSQNQFDALVSLVFNIGQGAFSESTLWWRIRSGQAEKDIRREWLRWVYSGKQKLAGLVKRRKWEADLYFSSPSPTLPQREGA